jgi:hypothetical protein
MRSSVTGGNDVSGELAIPGAWIQTKGGVSARESCLDSAILDR